MTTVTAMTADKAREFRAGRDARVLELSRMSNVALRLACGLSIHHRGMSRDELITEALRQDGYTIARLNEAIHTLYHDVAWPDCPYCKASTAAQELAGVAS